MKRKNLILGLLIISLCLIAYLPSLNNGFIWDDDNNLLEKNLNGLTGLGEIWFPSALSHQYYPLTHTSFWMEYQLWKFHPLGYHAINVFLHALGAILLWRLLGFLGVKGNFWVALIFAVHPVYVESVAWITERKNVLSGIFYFLSLLSFFRYYFEAKIQTTPPAARQSYLLSILFFTLGMFSKTSICTLPLVILVILWWKKGRISTGDLKVVMPFFAIAVVFGLITMTVEHSALGSRWGIPLLERCLIAGRVFWFYPSKILWPQDLCFMYPSWGVDTKIWWQYLFPAAMIGVIAVLWSWQGKIGRGTFAAVLYFTVTLLPVMGFADHYMMRYSFVADHLQYIPSIGIVVLSVNLAIQSLKLFSEKKRILLGAGIIVALMTITYHQGKIYKDNETLYRDIIAKNPSSLMAYNNLASEYVKQGKFEDAISEYKNALKVNPAYWESLMNLGWVYNRLGRFDEAIEIYKTTLMHNPQALHPKFELAKNYSQKGMLNEALEALQQILAKDPGLADAHLALGEIYEKMGSAGLAAEEYRKALELNPNLEEIRMRLENLSQTLPK